MEYERDKIQPTQSFFTYFTSNSFENFKFSPFLVFTIITTRNVKFLQQLFFFCAYLFDCKIRCLFLNFKLYFTMYLNRSHLPILCHEGRDPPEISVYMTAKCHHKIGSI